MSAGSSSLAFEPPLDSPQGAAIVFDRALAGDPAAMRSAALLRGAGVQCGRDWQEALGWLTQSAVGGDFAARAELIALSDDDDLSDELNRLEAARQVAPGSLWRRFGEGIDLARLLSAPAGVETVIADPLLGTVKNMASPRACQWLARRALSQLERAKVHLEGVAGQVYDAQRTNTTMSFRLTNAGLPLLALQQRIAAMLGVRTSQFEPTQVMRYEPGQTFHPHFDAFLDDEAGRAFMAVSGGQRMTTLLVSLNANYEGGETQFPGLRVNYRGEMGQAIFWSNADAAGRRDERTQHTGRPPTSGTKWIVSQWVRGGDYVE